MTTEQSNKQDEATQDPGTALISADEINPVTVFTKDGIEPIVKQIEEIARSHVPDVSTCKGRQAIKSLAHKVARSKTLIDTTGKDHTAEIKKKASVSDAARKVARDRLDALKEEVRKPLTEWEEEQARIKAEDERKEKERVTKIGAMISANFGMDTVSGIDTQPAVIIQARIQRVSAINISIDEYQEFVSTATDAKNKLLAHLQELCTRKTQQEEDERKRKEEDARLKAEREKLEKERREFEAKKEEERKAEEARKEDERKAEEAKKLEEQKQAEAEAKAADEAKEPKPEDVITEQESTQKDTEHESDNVVNLEQSQSNNEEQDAIQLVKFSYAVRSFAENNAPSDLTNDAAKNTLQAALVEMNAVCDRILQACNDQPKEQTQC